ncbi:MAG: hypothetical protein PVG49_20000 [Desulfobacteraceae bacterium]|jgi:hypothetical protein
MEANFDDILELEDVKGVVVLSKDGQLLFQKFSATAHSVKLKSKNWSSFLQALEGIREADFIFESARLYVRDSAGGYLLVLMGHFAPIAMVRLNCDILLPTLKQAHATKGLARFFKRKH